MTTAFVTLQRPPPLTRILAPSFLAPSRTATERFGLRRRAKIAVASPAAPPPMMAISSRASLTVTIFPHADVCAAVGRPRAVARGASPDADALDDPALADSAVGDLRGLRDVSPVSPGHLRPVEQDTDGECRARSARAARRDHSRSCRSPIRSSLSSKDDIAFVYGSKWKQRYFTKVGDDYFPLGAQWDIDAQDMASVFRSAETPIGGCRSTRRQLCSGRQDRSATAAIP